MLLLASLLFVWILFSESWILNWQVTWRGSLTWRLVLCVTSRLTLSQPFRSVSNKVHTCIHPELYTVSSGIPNRRWSSSDWEMTCLCFSQGSSLTLWSLSLRSGTASPSPACSAGPWWVTCTRTRPAGATYDTHTPLQTCKHTPKLRSLKEEEERGRKSLNLPLVSWGVSSSCVSGGEECLSNSLFVLQHIFSHCWSFTGSESGSTGWWSLACIRE